jgi:hypothetical protein
VAGPVAAVGWRRSVCERWCGKGKQPGGKQGRDGSPAGTLRHFIFTSSRDVSWRFLVSGFLRDKNFEFRRAAKKLEVTE